MHLKTSLVGVLVALAMVAAGAGSAQAYDNGLVTSCQNGKPALLTYAKGQGWGGDAQFFDTSQTTTSAVYITPASNYAETLAFCDPITVVVSNGPQTLTVHELDPGTSGGPNLFHYNIPPGYTLQSVTVGAYLVSHDQVGMSCANSFLASYNAGSPIVWTPASAQSGATANASTYHADWTMKGTNIVCSVGGEDSSGAEWGAGDVNPLQGGSHDATPPVTISFFSVDFAEAMVPRTDTMSPAKPMNVSATGGNQSVMFAGLNQEGEDHDNVYPAASDGTCNGVVPQDGSAPRTRVYSPIASQTLTSVIIPSGGSETFAAGTTYSFCVAAVDAVGNESAPVPVSATTTSTFPPDTTPPTVSLTAPANGATISGAVPVSATATDNVAVASVQFKLDGANLGAAVTSPPYQVSWNTVGASNGAHTLTAVATDGAGNTSTPSSKFVVVSNGGGSCPAGEIGYPKCHVPTCADTSTCVTPVPPLPSVSFTLARSIKRVTLLNPRKGLSGKLKVVADCPPCGIQVGLKVSPTAQVASVRPHMKGTQVVFTLMLGSHPSAATRRAKSVTVTVAVTDKLGRRRTFSQRVTVHN